MKQLILATAILCSLSLTANAQYGSLTFNNNTSCTVYVEINGTTNGNGCTSDYSTSAYIAIPTGTTIFADPTAVTPLLSNGTLTLGATDVFTEVKVVSSDPNNNCATLNSFILSGCTSGSVTTQTGFAVDDNTCTNCGTLDFTSTWTAIDGTIDIN